MMTVIEELQTFNLNPVELENLRVLLAARALSFTNGSITVHYDSNGVIQKVDNFIVSYKRKA